MTICEQARVAWVESPADERRLFQQLAGMSAATLVIAPETGGCLIARRRLTDAAGGRFVGPSLESLLGRVRFIAVYLLSAVGGGVMYYFLAPQNYPAVGASGAIFGLFGAWFVVSRRLRLDTRGIVVLIAINLALSFFFHNVIAWQDHIGGLLTGALLTAAYVYAPRKNRVALQVLATVVVIALIVVAVVIRNGQLTSGGV